MALFGEGRGFKLLVVFTILVILLTLPLRFIELKSDGLLLATTAEPADTTGQRPWVPIACTVDHRAKTIRLDTVLSIALPSSYPLRATVVITGTQQQELGNFALTTVDQDVKNRARIRLRGPVAITSQPADWNGATVHIQFLRERVPILQVTGVYRSGEPHLHQVQVSKP